MCAFNKARSTATPNLLPCLDLEPVFSRSHFLYIWSFRGNIQADEETRRMFPCALCFGLWMEQALGCFQLTLCISVCICAQLKIMWVCKSVHGYWMQFVSLVFYRKNLIHRAKRCFF